MKPARIVLILVVIAVLAAGAMVAGSLLPSEEPRFSSFSPQGEGTKALYLLLEERDVPVSRWEDSWDRLPESKGHVLFLLEPDRWLVPAEEKEWLLKWVESGNTLVLLAHPLDSLANQLGFSGAEGGNIPRVSMELQDEPWLSDIKELYFPRNRRLMEDTELDEVWEDRNGIDRIGRLAAGEGNIYYIPEPMIWTNTYLQRGDNLALALYFASLTEGEGKVWFDESLRYQGWNHAFLVDESEAGPGYADLIPAGAGWFLLQAGLLFLLWMVLQGKRFASPRWETVREVRRGEEYVHAMGSLYQWANLNQEALGIGQRALFREAADMLGMSRRSDADDIIERVEALVDPTLARRYRDLHQAIAKTEKKRISNKELVKWSREIQDLREEMNQWKTQPLSRQRSLSDPNE
ncbi:DUF4350 domain-containing protein [Desmospora profundinema]|uniref:DUF4350 domain-containing protein n=1 Tax=Desmospora profundinema TaxID=1571184 RepID=A0ABU1IHR0_9BACL|nr:DUF4350 domain-containing protein [Desmospora profundinema]MDR6224312.1 hypothetical protein [Desmospora profundinema]